MEDGDDMKLTSHQEITDFTYDCGPAQAAPCPDNIRLWGLGRNPGSRPMRFCLCERRHTACMPCPLWDEYLSGKAIIFNLPLIKGRRQV